MAKRNKKLSKTALKLEALEQRQLLAGIVGGGTEVTPGGAGVDNYIQLTAGKYDQVLMTGQTVSITNDLGTATRVSFLDLNGDIVQAEFSGSGTLSISLSDFSGPAAPENYTQDVQYVKGNASFTITGSDSSTNFTVFSVGTGNAFMGADTPIFAGGKTGGDHFADVARLTIVADPSNPNGSVFGGIYAGNAVFSASSGVVGISAQDVHVQQTVRIGDVDAKGTATPTVVLGAKSQFVSLDVTGGDMLQTNGKSVYNTGSYAYSLSLIAGQNSGGVDLPAQTVPPSLSFTGPNPIQTAAAKTITLTGNIDQGVDFIGGAGNDTFVGNTAAGAITLTSLDNIDGGAGNDQLNMTVTAAIDTTTAINAKIANIESVSMTSLAGVTTNTTAWTGLTSLTIAGSDDVIVTSSATTNVAVTTTALSGAAGNELTVDGGKDVTVTSSDAQALTTANSNDINVGGTTAPVGQIVVTHTDTVADGADAAISGTTITTKGGTSVTINSLASPAAGSAAADVFTIGAIGVTGTTATTTVSVTQTKATGAWAANGDKIRVLNGAVTVTDVNAGDGTKAGTIASVTLNNYGASTIDSSALTDVTLTGTGGTLGIGRGALNATPTANTLTLNVSGLTGGAITDSEAGSDDGFQTINIASSGSASTIADLVAADAKTINISGDKKLTLSDVSTIGAVTAINVTNTAGAELKGTAIPNAAVFTGGEGADYVVLAGSTKATTMGAGDDTVVLSGSALGTGGSVDAGDGTDTLTMTDANAVTASAGVTFEGSIAGFEKLNLTLATAANQTVNLNNLDDINHVTIAGVNVGNTLTLSGATTGMNLMTSSNVAGTVAVSLGNATSNDVLNFTTSANDVANTVFNLTAGGFETINFTTTNTKTSSPAAVSHVITTLGDTDLTTINVSGSAGLTISNSDSTKLATFDASGVTKGKVDLTTAALTVEATITGGADGDSLVAAASTKAVTINGGAGADTITGSSSKASTLNGDAGNDVITGGAAADVVNGGDGTDTFVANFAGDIAGASTALGAVVNLSDATLTQASVYSSTAMFLTAAAPTVAANSATYLFNGESSTDVSIVDSLTSIENATGTSGADYLVGSGSANVLTGMAGADFITTGAGSDTVTLTHAATSDTVTDFTKGSGGDKVAFSLATLGQTFLNGGATAVVAGAATVKEVAAGATTLAAGENVIVLNGTFANSAAMITAIGGGTHAVTWGANPAANADIIVVWSNGTDTFVSTVNDADTADTTAMLAAELTATELATLKGVNGTAAGSFGSGNFSFV